MSKYEYVIWDFNGTLIDDVDLCLDILNIMVSKRNIPTVTMEQYKEVFGFPIQKYYAKVGFDFEKEPFAVSAIEFVELYQPQSLQCGLHDGTIETLEKIKEMGLKQLILSASEINNLLAQTKHYDLDKYMIDVLGIDNIHASSKVDIAKGWMAKNKIDPNKILFVGDTDHDFEVATAIGVEALLVASGHQSKRRLLLVTDNVVDNITDVISKL